MIDLNTDNDRKLVQSFTEHQILDQMYDQLGISVDDVKSARTALKEIIRLLQKEVDSLAHML